MSMNETTIIAIVILLLIIVMILFAAWLYIFLPIGMAKKRGRSVIATLLLFWFLSPIAGILILLIIGDAENKNMP
jgi:hypothetical protein